MVSSLSRRVFVVLLKESQACRYPPLRRPYKPEGARGPDPDHTHNPSAVRRRVRLPPVRASRWNRYWRGAPADTGSLPDLRPRQSVIRRCRQTVVRDEKRRALDPWLHRLARLRLQCLNRPLEGRLLVVRANDRTQPGDAWSLVRQDAPIGGPRNSFCCGKLM